MEFPDAYARYSLFAYAASETGEDVSLRPNAVCGVNTSFVLIVLTQRRLLPVSSKSVAPTIQSRPSNAASAGAPTSVLSGSLMLVVQVSVAGLKRENHTACVS